MRTIYLMYGLIFLFLQLSSSQPWHYDFASSSGSFTTASSTSNSFLPQPESGEDFVRVGSQGGGFYLENPGIADLGSDTELRGVASTGTSVNKFSVYDYSGSQAFTIKFTVRFGGAASGVWSFFQGDGANFSNGSNYTSSQTFTGLQWTFDASDAITTEYRTGGSWTGLAGIMPSQNRNYTVEIYGNNSSSSVNYNYNGAQSVAQNSFDLWVDGVLVGNDLAKSALTDGANVDSYMFIGRSSSGNAANIYIDDITYTNIISDQPLPVELSSFNLSSGDHYVDLRWTTQSEMDNLGYIISRSNKKSGEYLEIASYDYFDQLKGAGTTSERSDYHFCDKTTINGITYWYKLSDVDVNGIVTEHGPLKATPHKNIIENSTNTNPEIFELCQNYPNPFNPSTTIMFKIPSKAENTNIILNVYDLRGNIVRSYPFNNISSGSYQIKWDGKAQNGNAVSSGIYIYSLKSSQFCTYKKMTLLR